MDSKDADSFMFANQTHVMSEDLLNALDILIDLSAGTTDDMCQWCLSLLKTVDPGDEFTVTAEQAKWLISNAQETFESIEVEEGEEPEQENQEYLDLIVETFDDYANFLRLSQNDTSEADIFRVVSDSKDK